MSIPLKVRSEDMVEVGAVSRPERETWCREKSSGSVDV